MKSAYPLQARDDSWLTINYPSSSPNQQGHEWKLQRGGRLYNGGIQYNKQRVLSALSNEFFSNYGDILFLTTWLVNHCYCKPNFNETFRFSMFFYSGNDTCYLTLVWRELKVACGFQVLPELWQNGRALISLPRINGRVQRRLINLSYCLSDQRERNYVFFSSSLKCVWSVFLRKQQTCNILFIS